jgi:hypothetical protein
MNRVMSKRVAVPASQRGTLESGLELPAASTSKGLPPPLLGLDFCTADVLVDAADLVLDASENVAEVEDALTELCTLAEDSAELSGADETAGGVDEATKEVTSVELMIGELDVSMMIPMLDFCAADDDGVAVLSTCVVAGVVVTWMLLQSAGMPWPSRNTPMIEVSDTSAFAHCEFTSALI